MPDRVMRHGTSMGIADAAPVETGAAVGEPTNNPVPINVETEKAGKTGSAR